MQSLKSDVYAFYKQKALIIKLLNLDGSYDEVLIYYFLLINIHIAERNIVKYI